MRIAILTVSDKGSEGLREDASGPVIKDIFTDRGDEVVFYEVIPDEKKVISKKLRELADNERADLLITTGGTGFALRDVTPEATGEVIDREAPGLGEKMRAETAKYTELAYLSRARSGLRHRSLILNLPGSPKAVKECLAAVIDIIPHGISVLQGEITEH